jgi:protein involved in polysaccharide export with SLBB domain
MNDMAFLCEDAVADAGGLAPTDVDSLSHRLRRNVNSARGYERLAGLVIARAAR